MTQKNQPNVDALAEVTGQLTEVIQNSGLAEVRTNLQNLIPWVKRLNEQIDILQRELWQHKTDLALLRQENQEIKNQQNHYKNVQVVNQQGKWQAIVAIITASAALITSIVTIVIQLIPH